MLKISFLSLGDALISKLSIFIFLVLFLGVSIPIVVWRPHYEFFSVLKDLFDSSEFMLLLILSSLILFIRNDHKTITNYNLITRLNRKNIINMFIVDEFVIILFFYLISLILGVSISIVICDSYVLPYITKMVIALFKSIIIWFYMCLYIFFIRGRKNMIIHLNILFQSIKKIRKIIYLYMLFFLILVLYTKFSMYIDYNNIFLNSISLYTKNSMGDSTISYLIFQLGIYLYFIYIYISYENKYLVSYINRVNFKYKIYKFIILVIFIGTYINLIYFINSFIFLEKINMIYYFKYIKFISIINLMFILVSYVISKISRI